MTNEFALISNTFCTVNASVSLVNYFISGFFASLVLILGVLCCLQGKGARDWLSTPALSTWRVEGGHLSGDPTVPGLISKLGIWCLNDMAFEHTTVDIILSCCYNVCGIRD